MNPISVIMTDNGEIDATPSYLFDHNELYKKDAREAGRTWFREASYGLGIHYGLYSLIGKGEEALANGDLTAEEYCGLSRLLKADRFDANELVEFAIANGMRYVNFSVRTSDGFSLYNTSHSDFNSVKTPACRDLLGELASVCEYHGIGLCLNYSLGTDWHHPQGPHAGRDLMTSDIGVYKDFVLAQMEELLTQYGPIGAICLTGLHSIWNHQQRDAFQLDDICHYIHHLQPQVLVSFEQGMDGGEDFFSCVDAIPAEDAEASVQGLIHRQTEKPLEIRCSLTPGFWGYHVDQAGKHLREEAVWERLRSAQRYRSNLLVNTALMPDGSPDYEDMQTLLEIGKRIEKGGYPR